MDWQSIGVLTALGVAIGGVLGTIFAGGRFVQQQADMKEDFANLQGWREDTDKELAAGKVRFATLETKLDQILRQQDRTIAAIDKLAAAKDR